MALFDFSRGDAPVPKLIFTQGQFSIPSNGSEFSTARKSLLSLLAQPWAYSIDLIISEEVYETIWPDVQCRLPIHEYYRVSMPLSTLVEGDFFNKYIKSGNVEMLSEGRAGLDTKYRLRNGLLLLEVPKDLYERVGLVGKSIQDAGRKHKKSRFLIELNLREPSMVTGRKAFERVKWAFKNVLNQSVTWLFHDLQTAGQNTSESTPVVAHQPVCKVLQPTIKHHYNIATPKFQLPSHAMHSDEHQEDAADLLEWLSLVPMDSPRIVSGDAVDPYLSRYAVPYEDEAVSQNLVSVRWRGFITAQWMQGLFAAMCFAFDSNPSHWWASSVRSFTTTAIHGTDGYSLLVLPNAPLPNAGDDEEEKQSTGGRGFYLWEMKSSVDLR